MPPETLLSVPPAVADFIRSEPPRLPSWLRRVAGSDHAPTYVSSDPPARRLGSGGGTVHLLYAAWREQGKGMRLESWIKARQRLVLHAGGESRRLPAYATLGKAFIPTPEMAALMPAEPDRVLADLQLPLFREALSEAGPRAAVLVASGDVWLRFDAAEIPAVHADVVPVGMPVPPETARHFGVFYTARSSSVPASGPIAIQAVAQKPSLEDLRERSRHCHCLVDTGLWFLSTEALAVLFARCGWDKSRQRFATEDGLPRWLDLYTEVGACLGKKRRVSKALRLAGARHLTSALIPLPSGHFHHLGSSRQLLESMEQLQSQAATRDCLLASATVTPFALAKAKPRRAWVEGCAQTHAVRLGGDNVVTGLPPGSSVRNLAAGECLEVAPTGNGDRFIVRPYAIDDTLRGFIPEATICGQPALQWLSRRGLQLADNDILDARLYPIVRAEQIDQTLVEWFFAASPDNRSSLAWLNTPRVSARELPAAVSLVRSFRQRASAIAESYRARLGQQRQAPEPAFGGDLASLAAFIRRDAPALAPMFKTSSESTRSAPLERARHRLFTQELEAKGRRSTDDAYQELRDRIVASLRLTLAQPQRKLAPDQMAWGRSPARLDLAGGWSDTPPYCLAAGGAVLNVAVQLNGQSPIQAFVRFRPGLALVLRSIDQGTQETVTSGTQLQDYSDPNGAFSLLKACVAVAGFLPEFSKNAPKGGLSSLLRRLGGGLDISVLSAVPKGSGLGTSSILAATVLGTLNAALGLGWNTVDLYDRTLAVEQLLTTGGGWQDQAGALYPGAKLITTNAGDRQQPHVRQIDPHLLESAAESGELLLYYTGITRLAKAILREIVRDMFLRRQHTQRVLGSIRANAHRAAAAFQARNRTQAIRAIQRSWRLNRALDAGTSPPAIDALVASCGTDLAACKLLGAGGGGFMLLWATDPAAGRRMRRKLSQHGPLPGSRFVDFSICHRGFEVTRT